MTATQIKALDSRIRKQFENAKLALERGNFGYTIEICSNLLLKEPGCLEVRELLRLAQQNDFAKGRSLFGRLNAWLQKTAYVTYGQPYVKKDPVRAMDFGEKALCRDPFDEKALSLIASGAEKLELHDTSVFCLKGICERGTNDTAIMQRYCEALIHIGDTQQAISIADRLSKLKPESGAIQELVKAASVAHSINRGKWAEEKEDFRSKLKDEEEADRLERENRLEESTGGSAATISELRKEIQLDPQNLDLYKRLVRLLVSKEDFRGALSWLEKAFQHPQADADLTLHQLEGEIQIMDKEQELEKLKVNKTENAERIEVLESELDALKLEEARKMVDQFPNDFAQRLRYGELLLNADKLDEAIQQFQVSQRSSNLKLRSHVLLGRSFRAKRLFDLALEQFDFAIEGALTMDEFKKEVIYLSAECCEKLGKDQDAVRRYKLIYASDISFRDVAEKVNSLY